MTAAERLPGSAAQAGSPRSTAASVSLTSLALERSLTREHLEEHAAERPDVAALVGRPSLRLLRAHVRRRPENHAHSGHQRWPGDRRRLR